MCLLISKAKGGQSMGGLSFSLLSTWGRRGKKRNRRQKRRIRKYPGIDFAQL